MSQKPWPGLSQQEESVLACTAAGLADKEVAAAMRLSIHTVRTYWKRIRAKAVRTTRAEVIAETSRRRTTQPHSFEASGQLGEDQVPTEDARISEIMDRLNPAVYVGTITPEGIVRYANRAALEAVNCTLEDVIGKPFAETPWWAFAADARAQLGVAIREAACGNPSRFEFSLKDADGGVLTLDFMLQPVSDELGTTSYLVPSAQDITKRKSVESELRLHRFAVDSAVVSLFVVRRDASVYYANESASRLLGYEREALKRMHLFEIDSEINGSQWPECWSILLQRSPHTFETKFRKADKSVIPVEVFANYLKYDDEEYVFLHALDATSRRESEERIRHMASFDELTGLPNRAGLEEHLKQALQRAERYKLAVTVLHIGLDRFKLVNEAMGAHAGNALLTASAGRITQCVREVDTVARVGGDEFVVVIGGEASDDEGSLSAENRLLIAFSDPFIVEGSEVFVTCSIGVAAFPKDGTTAEELLRNVSLALAAAKTRGRNIVVKYSGSSPTADLDRLRLETALRKSLAQFDFNLQYQPQVDLASNCIIGAEALIRWNHPESVPVPPSRFIPIAEETGLILPMGDWVLTTACREKRRLFELGLFPGRVSVNVSARQFHQPGFAKDVAKILYNIGADPQDLELELTESSLIEDIESAIQTMTKLRDIGIHLALDDFGTGYSSLNYLRRFPIDKLKIDISFVSGVSCDEGCRAIAETVVMLAHRLGMLAIAEGVETEGQREMLGNLGCDHIQGFLVSKPLDVEDLAGFVREHHTSKAP